VQKSPGAKARTPLSVSWQSVTYVSGIIRNPCVRNGPLQTMAIPLGFEPRTYSLEGCRSIQLSYGTVKRGIAEQDKGTVGGNSTPPGLAGQLGHDTADDAAMERQVCREAAPTHTAARPQPRGCDDLAAPVVKARDHRLRHLAEGRKRPIR
jgi:hypothetical protein